MKPKIRPLYYVYNSRIDFTDAWMNCTLILMGLILLLTESLEKVDHYTFLVQKGITSNGLGIYSLCIGGMNLIRIFLPFKPNIFLSSVLKSLTLSVFTLIFIVVLTAQIDPISIAFYFMLILLAFDNLIRTL